MALSNLAWSPKYDAQIAASLKRARISDVEIAPSKYFKLSGPVEGREVKRVRNFWESRGIRIFALQSLMFGCSSNIFGGDTDREAAFEWLRNIISIGRRLGASALVFGSPNNRRNDNFSTQRAKTIATEFFRKIGDEASLSDVVVCIEPSSLDSVSNFLTGSAETIDFVNHVDHPQIRVQFDTGALLTNGENPSEIVELGDRLFGHIHLSRPKLEAFTDGFTFPSSLCSAIESVGLDVATIEMLSNEETDAELQVNTAVQALQRGPLRWSTGQAN